MEKRVNRFYLKSFYPHEHLTYYLSVFSANPQGGGRASVQVCSLSSLKTEDHMFPEATGAITLDFVTEHYRPFMSPGLTQLLNKGAVCALSPGQKSCPVVASGK